MHHTVLSLIHSLTGHEVDGLPLASLAELGIGSLETMEFIGSIKQVIKAQNISRLITKVHSIKVSVHNAAPLQATGVTLGITTVSPERTVHDIITSICTQLELDEWQTPEEIRSATPGREDNDVFSKSERGPAPPLRCLPRSEYSVVTMTS